MIQFKIASGLAKVLVKLVIIAALVWFVHDASVNTSLLEVLL